MPSFINVLGLYHHLSFIIPKNSVEIPFFPITWRNINSTFRNMRSNFVEIYSIALSNAYTHWILFLNVSNGLSILFTFIAWIFLLSECKFQFLLCFPKNLFPSLENIYWLDVIFEFFSMFFLCVPVVHVLWCWTQCKTESSVWNQLYISK